MNYARNAWSCAGMGAISGLLMTSILLPTYPPAIWIGGLVGGAVMAGLMGWVGVIDDPAVAAYADLMLLAFVMGWLLVNMPSILAPLGTLPTSVSTMVTTITGFIGVVLFGGALAMHVVVPSVLVVAVWRPIVWWPVVAILSIIIAVGILMVVMYDDRTMSMLPIYTIANLAVIGVHIFAPGAHRAGEEA